MHVQLVNIVFGIFFNLKGNNMLSNTEKVYKLLTKGYAKTTQELIDFLSHTGMKAIDVYKSLDILQSEGHIRHDVEEDLWTCKL